MAQLEILTAGQIDQERILATVVKGVVADSLTRRFWPEADNYLEVSPDAFDAFGGEAIPTQTTCVTGNFSGVAMWLPPGDEAPDGCKSVFTWEVGMLDGALNIT